MTAAMIAGLGPWELLIILAIILLLVGGSRLAGIGRSSGKAIRNFKEETKELREERDRKEIEE
jgi:sec-independent protein translocase protein TatA